MSICKSFSSLSDDMGVWIAIKVSSGKQLHLGFLCKDDDSSQVFHLLGHYDLRCSENTSNYKYINVTQFNEANHIHMSAAVQSLFEAYQDEGLPYGPCGGGFFSPQGEFEGNIGDGMTCSSFVLETFESQGYKLINRSSWPIRKDDMDWQKDLILDFKYAYYREPNDVEHFRIQEEKIGALRFRPHEVAASTTFDTYNNDFNDIEPISIKIYKELIS